jgi:hypothetical protein
MKKMTRAPSTPSTGLAPGGDGSEEPSWGTPAQSAALSPELAQEAKSSAEMA